jgi:hypothetical protein
VVEPVAPGRHAAQRRRMCRILTSQIEGYRHTAKSLVARRNPGEYTMAVCACLATTAYLVTV